MVDDVAVLSGPDGLTNAWLTAALRGGAVGAPTVAGHAWEPVEAQGATSIVVRVTLDYDTAEDRAPSSLIAKFASPHAPIRTLIHAFGLPTRETRFYQQFGDDAGVPTPRCFHAGIDAASGAFVLLLEDLSDARVGDGLAPSPEDAEVAVRHLAPFHARWWGSEQLRGLDWLRYPGSSGFSSFMQQAKASFAFSLPVVRQRFEGHFPPVLSEVGERLIAGWEEAIAVLGSSPVTLVHGDYHPQQMFFPSERGGRFAVFDWQTVAAGRGADDLARIIATGLTPEQREAQGGRLVDLYYALLMEHGVRGYERWQFLTDLRRGFISTFVINAIAGASIDPELFRQREAVSGMNVAEALFGRVAAAVEAYDVLALLPPVP